ncbi:hypothetical protein U14_03379 [Candidatus Moduliflexus flocculans]|uniref:Gamma carbonic anhydrase family protein n=1 Tax=Candidatus Moduliflexus flocculans TaxID=1499966 RepID=A0A081BP13_9BACT|nr:hypothetical protein U14_03379 [Candidatus Moduliflexus flocculans]
MVKQYRGIWPEIHPSAFIEESAQIIGDVVIGADSSVWFQAILRGDVGSIRVGARTNVQDGAIIHESSSCSIVIGNDVTIGHRAVLHGCVVHDCCLIGIGAVILDGAEIGENSIIGAGAVIPEGMIVPPKSVVLGIPGTVRRMLDAEDIQRLKDRATRYVAHKNTYREPPQNSEVFRSRNSDIDELTGFFKNPQ